MLVSLSSAVAEMCEGVSLDSGSEFVEPESFSFSKERSVVCVENQEDMSCEGTPVKVPPRRRMMPRTPQQSSRLVKRTVIARMVQYLNASDCMKLEIEELELPHGPENSEVTSKYILRNASRRGGRMFEIFNTKENREHLVASRVRRDERHRLKVARSSSDSSCFATC